MGVFYETIPDSLQEWIVQQKMFFVGTAPMSRDGQINVSPKGGPYFGVSDNKTFWYTDLSGSGNETISHLHENGRVTIMLNAYDGPPKIVRLWGKGEVLEYGTNAFSLFVQANKIELIPGVRSIIVVHIHQVGSSCGFSVPYYDFKDFRPILNDFMRKKEERFMAGKTEESMDRYWAYKNAWSIDGLPGMKRGMQVGKRDKVVPLKKMVGAMSLENRRRHVEMARALSFVAVACFAFMLGILVTTYAHEINQKYAFNLW